MRSVTSPLPLRRIAIVALWVFAATAFACGDDSASEGTSSQNSTNAPDVGCLSAPCRSGAWCANGVITIHPNSWETPCDQLVSCQPPVTIECPADCAPEALDYDDLIDIWYRSLGDVEAIKAAACAPPPCSGPFATAPVQRALAYGDDPRQILDLYLPDTPAGAPPTPLFIWIHGGGWRGGSLASVPPQILALRERGVAVASIEYRLSDTPWPTTVSDVRAAVRWLRAVAFDYNLNTDRFAAGGSSAGGHLAAMLGVASNVEGLDVDSVTSGSRSPGVQLVLDLFGPSDLLTMDADAEANGCQGDNVLCHSCVDSPETNLIDCDDVMDTCAERAQLASPITHATHDDPPFIIAHGAVDCVVPTPQAARLRDALNAAGAPTPLYHIIDGAGHNVGEVLTEAVLDDLHDAIDAHLLQCARTTTPTPEPPPLSACLTDACPELADACTQDDDCLRVEACIQACFGTQGCAATCLEDASAPTRQAHRALFDCGREAECYPAP